VKSRSRFSQRLIGVIIALGATVVSAAANTESTQELSDALLAAAGKGDSAAVRALLDRGADPNAVPPPQSLNALESAVSKNHFDVVKILVDHGADLRPSGDSVLGLAADKKHEAITRFLISRGLKVDDRDSRGATLLLKRFGYSPIPVDEIEFLLDLGANPNVRTEEGMTPLMIIAGHSGYGNTESEQIAKVMRMLIKHGAQVNARGNLGGTPLIHAVADGSMVAIRALVEAGADINLANNHGQSPLLIALQRFYRDGRIEYLMKHGADVEARDEDGITTLMAAIVSGYRTRAEQLIKRGVDPNARAKNGRTAAHSAASYYNRRYDRLEEDARNRYEAVEMLRLLLTSGSDLAAADNDTTTPLHSATMNGYVDAVRFLVEHGADLNQANAKGETPLFLSIASDIDSFDKMKFLLTKGANVNLPGPEGQTPLMLASRLMMPGYVVYLLARKANADAKDGSGNTALSLAAKAYGEQAVNPRDYTAIVRAVANASSSVDQRDAIGMSPLMWTAISNLPEAMNAVLAKGADVDARSSDGRTALMWAASANALDTIRILISKRADVRATDNTGRTALDWAKWMNQKEAVELLKSVSLAP
jgi:ankyrin repeat protein